MDDFRTELGPDFCVDLDYTIVCRRKPALNLGQRIAANYNSFDLGDDFSFNCFEGRPLIMRAKHGVFQICFRRGTYHFLSHLKAMGRVKIMTHACPSYATKIVNFLNRMLAGTEGIDLQCFNRQTNELKRASLSVRIFDDKVERWALANQGQVEPLLPFLPENTQTDIELYIYMARHQNLFPAFDPFALRFLMHASYGPNFPHDIYMLVLKYLIPLRPRPIRRCLKWFCGTWKCQGSKCSTCDLRDSEATAMGV